MAPGAEIKIKIEILRKKKYCQEGGGGHFQDQFINGTSCIKKFIYWIIKCEMKYGLGIFV